MEWEIQYIPGKKLIVVVSTGNICMDRVRVQAEEVAGLLRTNQATSVLLDFSRLNPGLSTAELWTAVDYYRRLGLPDLTGIALVQARSTADPFAFYQLGCFKAGFRVNLFESREVAESWLQSVGTS